jgi:Domain of unknown function (DUF5666)
MRPILPMVIGVLFVGSLLASSVLAQPAGTQIRGAVAAVAEDTVTLADGSSFPRADQARVTQIWPVAAADLVPGQYVAISAAPRDGALEASVVAVFPEGVRPAETQREMADVRFCEPGCQAGDLMTNATIEDAQVTAVESGELTVTFLGQNQTVRITPTTRIEVQMIGTLDDLVPGAEVIGFVGPQGSAATVWVFMPA